MSCEVYVHWLEPERPGEYGRKHQWMRITRRPLGLARAKVLADAQPCHATVTEWHSVEKLYDNRRLPGDGRPPIAQSLPKIVRFLGTDDCPGGNCPHCGAEGRFIHRFLVEDGRTLGAMSGCVKLFPVSPIANEQLRLQKKQIDYAKRGWKLNQWDTSILQAIEEFYSGKFSEQAAMTLIKCERRASVEWRRSRRLRLR